MIIESIGSVVLSVLDKFFPNQTEIKKADLELKLAALNAELQLELNRQGLLKGQMDINQAEAANPNRKWSTWRELAGYMVVLCLFWAWVLSPMVSFLAAMAGHPVNLQGVIQVDMIDVLYIFLGMLGLDSSAFLAGRLKNKMMKNG